MKGNKIATVDLDPIRAPVIKEMFEKVAYQAYSGRMIRKWLRKINFKTKNNLDLCLAVIYKLLKIHSTMESLHMLAINIKAHMNH